MDDLTPSLAERIAAGVLVALVLLAGLGVLASLVLPVLSP